MRQDTAPQLAMTRAAPREKQRAGRGWYVHACSRRKLMGWVEQRQCHSASYSISNAVVLAKSLECGTGKGACPHIGRSLRVATRSNPLVARSTALRRCLRFEVRAVFVFAHAHHRNQHAQKQKRRELQIAIT